MHEQSETVIDQSEATTIFERSPEQLAKSLDLACQCAKIADELKGSDIVVLDLTKLTPEFDFFVIATGNSRRQLHAIVEEADTLLEKSGADRISLEGYAGNNWILQDYGDIVLHAFDPENRELYDLERLWADATHVDWQAHLAKSN